MPKHHLVFVYGTLLRGLSNHAILAQARFLGTARTNTKWRSTGYYTPSL